MASTAAPPAGQVPISAPAQIKAKDQHAKRDTPKPSVLVHFAAGGFGGTVGAAITCPLEVVKTRLQSSLYRDTEKVVSLKNPIRATWIHMREVVGLLGQIRKQEGIRALWKGLGPNLVGVVPARAIYFATYSQGKHFYTQMNKGRETPVVHMLSAATAGIATGSVTNPIWLIKTRMQLQSERKDLAAHQRYRNSFHCLTTVVREEGVRALYRGLSASFLGIGESTLQFVTYEYLKKTWVEDRKARRLALLSPEERKEASLSNSPADWLDTFAAAGVAKFGAAIVTYPHEVLRTRLRQTPENGIVKYTGLVQSAKLIYKEEGMAALYGGMTAHLMRVVPNAAIMFFCYELAVAAVTKPVTP
ncbi:mitochondrial carrier domain-containing protein [Fimicolochytrium jonesii]|uniref:mitochondrial carrier domain-containing protein n=1 Tax=Fimicolochytrium jonesii TaxID=1396493 RepID=UPI0022FE52C7|nr:mitochondrial carrier domain-containing protein [Fimicolochytrium jonesii]KAI8817942.1 mitochondrial carrier domain-containing protein [Fimicolochytrium jonesii]